MLKANADEYFLLKHRQMRRGVGGTFFHAMGDLALVGAEAGPGQAVANPFDFIKDSTVGVAVFKGFAQNQYNAMF